MSRLESTSDILSTINPLTKRQRFFNKNLLYETFETQKFLLKLNSVLADRLIIHKMMFRHRSDDITEIRNVPL